MTYTLYFLKEGKTNLLENSKSNYLAWLKFFIFLIVENKLTSLYKSLN